MRYDLLIARAVQDLVDRPYALGDTKKGWDCLSLMWKFYGDLGVELPKEFKGFSAENYSEKWLKGEGRQEFREYLEQVGSPIGINYAMAGDLLIFDYKDFCAPGIYLGNGNVLCAYEKGIVAVPLKFLRQFVTGVRRCLI